MIEFFFITSNSFHHVEFWEKDIAGCFRKNHSANGHFFNIVLAIQTTETSPKNSISSSFSENGLLKQEVLIVL